MIPTGCDCGLAEWIKITMATMMMSAVILMASSLLCKYLSMSRKHPFILLLYWSRPGLTRQSLNAVSGSKLEQQEVGTLAADSVEPNLEKIVSRLASVQSS